MVAILFVGCALPSLPSTAARTCVMIAEANRLGLTKSMKTLLGLPIARGSFAVAQARPC